MKRSEINMAIKNASTFIKQNGWSLPPKPRWDVTDFGLGNFQCFGLVLINLAEEPEYCEKLMYATKDQLTPAHTHVKKKEDIICRSGSLNVRLWSNDPIAGETDSIIKLKVDGQMVSIHSGDEIVLNAGQRVTIVPGIWHEFYANTDECIIGEVSTKNDDLNDNFFSNKKVGRFSEIDEDEPVLVRLISDKN